MYLYLTFVNCCKMKQRLRINSIFTAGVVLFLNIFSIDQSCANVDLALASQSPVYGLLSKLANQNGTKDMCFEQMEKMFFGIENSERWALKMLDASGTPTHGFYWGNNDWISSKRQCFATSNHAQLQVSEKWRPVVKEAPDGITPFPVQLFAAYIRHNTTMQITIHWENDDLITLTLCLPNSCTTEQVSSLLQQYLEDKHLALQNVYNAALQLEYVKTTISDGQWIWDTKLLFIIGSILLSITLCVAGTCYDINMQNKLGESAERKRNFFQNNSKKNGFANGKVASLTRDVGEHSTLSKFLLSFSIPRNCTGTFLTTVLPDNIPSINGLRFLSMVMIVSLHATLFGLDFAMNRVQMFWQGLGNPLWQFIENSLVHVDTFFTIGGILISFLFFTDEKKRIMRGGNPNLTVFRRVWNIFVAVMRRFLRLTPAYLMAIGLAILSSTFNYNTSPRWTNERSDLVCSHYWWRNVLYINNLYPRSEMCLSWSWYLSNDMQFHIVALTLCTIALYSEKIALYLTGGIIAACSAFSWYMVYSNDLIPFFDEYYTQLGVLYDPPWIRIAPYLIGVLAGYVLANYKDKLNFRQRTIRNLWILCVVTFAVCTFALTVRDINVTTSATYFTLCRAAWGVAVSWVVIACFLGQGGYINSVLSYNGWIPLSRLTYCCYLINPILIYAVYSYSDISVSLSVVQVAVYGLLFACMSFVAAVIPVLLVEVPSRKLLKYFFDPYLVHTKTTAPSEKPKSK